MHVVQRSNNGGACFVRLEDRLCFLDWLETYAADTACEIHAYVLMSNHVHLLLTPRMDGGVSTLMKRLDQRYTQYVNRTYSRTGTLWDGRFFSCVVQSDVYVLRCYRYIELNPVRAGIVGAPDQFPWSSHLVNAHGAESSLIVPHPVFSDLASAPSERMARYRQLFSEPVEPEHADQIRRATRGNIALGDDAFTARLAASLNRRVTPGKPGKPGGKAASRQNVV